MTRRRYQGWRWCVLVVATCLAAPPAYGQGDPVDTASPADQAEARTKFLAAKQAFAERRFEPALEGFRASYALVASPNSHLMVANTLVELGRLAEAYAEADAVAVEAEGAVAAGLDKYRSAGEAARAVQERVRGSIGLLTVTVVQPPPEAAVVVNGRVLDRSRWGQPQPVDPGTAIVVLASGQGEQRQEVSIRAGGAETVTLGEPPPPPPPPVAPPPPTADASAAGGFNPLDQSDDQRLASYVVGGVGATGMLLFAIFGGMHLSQYGDLEEQCPAGSCPPELEADADSGRGYQAAANVSLVIGLVGLAGGAALFFTTDWFLDTDDGGAAEPGLARRPELLVGPGAIGVRGSF